MKEVILRIPDNKVAFFMEFVKQLGLEFPKGKDISEEHKRLVRERIRMSSANPSKLIEWDAIKDDFKF